MQPSNPTYAMVSCAIYYMQLFLYLDVVSCATNACNALQFFSCNNCRHSNVMENIHEQKCCSHEYFPSRWKACNYCTKKLQQIAHETTAL